MSDMGETGGERRTGKALNLVLEGGGAKGIALFGAAAALAEQGYAFRCLAGTSAGAFSAALLAANYTTEEIVKLIAAPDLGKFADPFFGVPILGSLIGMLTSASIYKGDYFLDYIRQKLLAKGVRVFGDLVDTEYVKLCERAGVKPEARLKYRMHVVTADITHGRMLILPDDLDDPLYRADPDRFEVALAVRMSMSIPFVFKPMQFEGAGGTKSYVVDGGLLSNCPVELFDPALPREWMEELIRCPDLRFYMGAGGVAYPGRTLADPRCGEVMDKCRPLLEYQGDPITLGVRVLQGKARAIGGFFLGPRLFYAVARTAIEAHDIRTIQRYETLDYARTVYVDTESIPVTKFGLKQAQKDMLYKSGHDTMLKFLSTHRLEDLSLAARAASLRANVMAEKHGGPGASPEAEPT